MKIITAPQPWASAAVFGRVEVLNAKARTQHRGRLLVHASGRDRRVAQDKAAAAELHNPLADVQDAILGVVDVVGCSSPADVQIPYAVGPAVIRFHTPRVFLAPVAWPRFKGIAHVDLLADPELREAIQDAVGPAEWLPRHGPTPRPEEVYPPRRDGWVGD